MTCLENPAKAGKNETNQIGLAGIHHADFEVNKAVGAKLEYSELNHFPNRNGLCLILGVWLLLLDRVGVLESN